MDILSSTHGVPANCHTGRRRGRGTAKNLRYCEAEQMSETLSSSAFRCEIDGLAGDMRFVRRTTSVLLLFSILFSVLGLFALFDGNTDIRTKLTDDALPTLISWMLTYWLWGLRQGRSASISRKILKGATILTLVIGIAHYALLKFGHFSGLSPSAENLENIAVMYGMALSLSTLLWVTCRKATRLSDFRPADEHLPQVRLLGKRKFGEARRRRRFVLPPVNRWPGVFAWALLAAVCAMLGSILAAVLVIVTKALSYVMPTLELLPLLGPIIVRPLLERSYKAAHMARRYQSADMRDLLAADQRPPVLLLRSFADDNRRISEASDSYWIGQDNQYWIGQSSRTFEEVLVTQLDRYGPVIAIGKPGEDVPSAGAAREYLADDAWQARVEELIAASAAIVVIAGKTPFLRWELARIESLGALSKMLIVIPAEGEEEAADRLMTLVENLQGARVSQLINDHLHIDALVAQFGRDSLLELASQSKQPQDYAIAVDIGMQVLMGMPGWTPCLPQQDQGMSSQQKGLNPQSGT